MEVPCGLLLEGCGRGMVKVKESRSQRGQNGISFGDTSGNDGNSGEGAQRPRDTGKGFCAAIPKFLHFTPPGIPTKKKKILVRDAPGSSHPSQIQIQRNRDWDPPNRLLELRIRCWESQIQPRERSREFLISEPGMKNGIFRDSGPD